MNENKNKNPIPELISDEIYEILNCRGLINERSVRDYLIRKKFRALRKLKMRAGEAIETLRNEHPYLQYDTIRKIVYQPEE